MTTAPITLDEVPERRKQILLSQWRRHLARFLLGMIFVALAGFGAVLSVGTMGRETYRWHGLEIELRLLPTTHGETVLALKPLGEIHARTHRAPLRLMASLERIEVDELKSLFTKKNDTTALTKEFEGYAQRTLKAFVWRQIAFAALGALLAPLLFRSRRVSRYVAAVVVGVGLVGGVLGSTLQTFNRQAFNEVTYTGAFKQAPWVIRFGKDAFTKFDALSSKLRLVADNLNVLYGRIAATQTDVVETDALKTEKRTLRVLHISDIHNNVAAFQFVRRVADQFAVSFIVDTGDLTDFGSQPELVMVDEVKKLPYRYVFVAGNHDSRLITAAMAKIPTVSMLNGQIITVNGLHLLGLMNPASRRDGSGNVDALPAETAANGAELLRLVNTASPDTLPDIVVTHDPREAMSVWGRVSVAMVGHLHRQYVERQTPPNAKLTTIVSNAGTTGAAGLRYFEGEGGKEAFTCSVLTFSVPNKPELRPRLLSADQILLDGTLSEYSIKHQTF